MTDSFFCTGDFFAESGVKKIEGYRLPRRYYSLINTVTWGFVVVVPMVYYLLRLLTSGSTMYISIGIGIIGICKYNFYVILKRLPDCKLICSPYTATKKKKVPGEKMDRRRRERERPYCVLRRKLIDKLALTLSFTLLND